MSSYEIMRFVHFYSLKTAVLKFLFFFIINIILLLMFIGLVTTEQWAGIRQHKQGRKDAK